MSRSQQVTLGADVEVFVATKPKAKVEPPQDTFDQAPRPITEWAEFKITQKATRASIWERASAIKAVQANIVPCVGLFPGTKKEPHHPKGWSKNFFIQEDNVMLEFNVPVCNSAMSLTEALSYAKEKVEKLCADKNLVPAWSIPEHKFKPKDLESLQAQTIGCDPDRSAYDGGASRGTAPDLGNLRTCGGHLHIGGNFNCPDFVVALFIEANIAFRGGAISIINHKNERQKWYGMPGIFRSKPYGIEYRTLSNGWAFDYGRAHEIALAAENVASACIEMPAQVIQKSFRQFPWMEFREALLNQVPNINGKRWESLTTAQKRAHKQAYSDWHNKWQELSNKFYATGLLGD